MRDVNRRDADRFLDALDSEFHFFAHLLIERG